MEVTSSNRNTQKRFYRYYNVSRTHLSLKKDSPEPRTIEQPAKGKVAEKPILNGLHHRYYRRAA
ncbi:MAG: hypothetical protein FJY65_11370 [Calditrichaeota bacterium]|nr:hypothetical protein [Calditrichota bacterium]